MRIVMAASADGYMSRSDVDDMSWLGAVDKAVFRILTGVGGAVGMGYATAAMMPKELGGRNMLILSRSGRQPFESWGTLEDFHREHPDGWLIGGPRLALVALECGYVDEVHLCHSDRMAFPSDPSALRDTVTPWLEQRAHRPLAREWWRLEMQTRLLDVTVKCWRHHEREQGK